MKTIMQTNLNIDECKEILEKLFIKDTIYEPNKIDLIENYKNKRFKSLSYKSEGDSFFISRKTPLNPDFLLCNGKHIQNSFGTVIELDFKFDIFNFLSGLLMLAVIFFVLGLITGFTGLENAFNNRTAYNVIRFILIAIIISFTNTLTYRSIIIYCFEYYLDAKVLNDKAIRKLEQTR